MCMLFLLIIVYAQDVIETEVLEIDQIRPQFENALRMFKSVERQNSLQEFERIATELQNRTNRNEDDSLMLSEILKYLAILTFPEKTEKYFEEVIRLNPGSEIMAGTMSPKFIRIFNELKAKLTGSLLVNLVEATDPTSQHLSGGKLLIDGNFNGFIEAGIPIPVLSGPHEITVVMPNFDPLVQQIDIVSNGQQAINGILYRNSADIGFVTYPNDVQVFLDGVEIGFTEGVSPQDYAEHLLAENLSPSQASSVFVINDVKPGNYEVRFQKPCFQTRKINVPVEELKSYRFKPVILQPSKATLTVRTVAPTAGIVYLDQERIGSLPLMNKDVCPGSYYLRVQFPDGQYIKKLLLAEGDTHDIIAKPQPSIAWFGIQEKEGKGPTDPIDQWFHELNAWNVLDIDSTDSTLISHDPYSILFDETKNIGDQGRILTQTIKADLFVAARVVRKKTIIRYLDVAFWSPLSPKIKVYSVDFRQMSLLKNILDEIDRPLELLSPWLGVETIQLKGVTGIKILSVHPNGPLAKKALPGQVITAVNGLPVKSPKAMLAEQFTTMLLKTENQNIEVSPIPAIVELPFVPNVLCPQAVLARLEKIGNYAEDTLTRDSAKFNMARYFFFMDDFQQAFDLFSSLDLPYPYGISHGTLLFYQGLCFQKLNLKLEAASSFENTVNYPHSSLFGPDGPKAKLWAETQLSILTSQ